MRDTPVAERRGRDWRLFREVATGSSALVMLGHGVVAGLDSERPASLSRTVVQRAIREEWRHDGVLVTDDMTMGAVYQRGLCEATVQALNAGVDLILIFYDYEKHYEAMYCAAKALREKRLDDELRADSRRRLQRLY